MEFPQDCRGRDERLLGVIFSIPVETVGNVCVFCPVTSRGHTLHAAAGCKSDGQPVLDSDRVLHYKMLAVI